MSDRLTAEEYNRVMYTRMGEQPEAVIKKQVKDWLLLQGWQVIPIQQGAKGLPIAHVKGISDLIILRDGRVVFLEVKTAEGRQSEYQERFEADVTAHGGEYRITRGIEDIWDLRWCHGTSA